MEFKLSMGCSAENLEGIHSAYQQTQGGYRALLSRELFEGFIDKSIDVLSEPLFFFLEIPCTEQEEKKLRKSKKSPFHYNVYYLDNCTTEVAKAIMTQYGQLLIEDGISKFGFGSHESGEEIYILEYNETAVYGGESFERIFKSLNIPNEENYKSLWDNFSTETPGECRMVEIDGETVYDIPENLKNAGMYHAQVRERQ